MSEDFADDDVKNDTIIESDISNKSQDECNFVSNVQNSVEREQNDFNNNDNTYNTVIDVLVVGILICGLIFVVYKIFKRHAL